MAAPGCGAWLLGTVEEHSSQLPWALLFPKAGAGTNSLFSWDLLTDGSLCPAAGQRFHLSEIYEAWRLRGLRGFQWRSGCRCTPWSCWGMGENPCTAAEWGRVGAASLSAGAAGDLFAVRNVVMGFLG